MSEPYDTFFIEIDHAAAPFPWLESLPFLQAHADRLGITIHWSYDRNLIIATPGGAKPQIIELSSAAEKNA